MRRFYDELWSKRNLDVTPAVSRMTSLPHQTSLEQLRYREGVFG